MESQAAGAYRQTTDRKTHARTCRLLMTIADSVQHIVAASIGVAAQLTLGARHSCPKMYA